MLKASLAAKCLTTPVQVCSVNSQEKCCTADPQTSATTALHLRHLAIFVVFEDDKDNDSDNERAAFRVVP